MNKSNFIILTARRHVKEFFIFIVEKSPKYIVDYLGRGNTPFIKDRI